MCFNSFAVLAPCSFLKSILRKFHETTFDVNLPKNFSANYTTSEN